MKKMSSTETTFYLHHYFRLSVCMSCAACGVRHTLAFQKMKWSLLNTFLNVFITKFNDLIKFLVNIRIRKTSCTAPPSCRGAPMMHLELLMWWKTEVWPTKESRIDRRDGWNLYVIRYMDERTEEQMWKFKYLIRC